MTGEDGGPRTQAAVAVAWLIVSNKPFYPLYVWYLAGAPAALASLWTIATAPLYVVVPLLARRSGALARLALPAAGLLDTLFATKLFGAAAGTELFLFPCALLGVVAFAPGEFRRSRALVGAVFLAFAALHGRYGAALGGFSPEKAALLFDLNAYSAAALTFFVAWRFSRPA